MQIFKSMEGGIWNPELEADNLLTFKLLYIARRESNSAHKVARA
jgi:hypothetical protein